MRPATPYYLLTNNLSVATCMHWWFSSLPWLTLQYTKLWWIGTRLPKPKRFSNKNRRKENRHFCVGERLPLFSWLFPFVCRTCTRIWFVTVFIVRHVDLSISLSTMNWKSLRNERKPSSFSFITEFCNNGPNAFNSSWGLQFVNKHKWMK